MKKTTNIAPSLSPEDHKRYVEDLLASKRQIRITLRNFALRFLLSGYAFVVLVRLVYSHWLAQEEKLLPYIVAVLAASVFAAYPTKFTLTVLFIVDLPFIIVLYPAATAFFLLGEALPYILGYAGLFLVIAGAILAVRIIKEQYALHVTPVVHQVTNKHGQFGLALALVSMLVVVPVGIVWALKLGDIVRQSMRRKGKTEAAPRRYIDWSGRREDFFQGGFLLARYIRPGATIGTIINKLRKQPLLPHKYFMKW